MIEEVAAYIEKHHMVEPKDHIIAGISGGADSVCLFLILERLRRKMGFSMSAVHVEHGIRGKESLLDQIFVKELSKKYGVGLSCYSLCVDGIAKKEKISVEEAGRMARYESFQKESEKYRSQVKEIGGRVLVAVAHHGNDNAETLLFHMCRGSGLDGLSGIRPIRDDIIRPLLCVMRREIEEFLREEHQGYCTDVTNVDVTYARNRIRCEVMPSLEKVNRQAVEHINQIAETMAELADFIKGQALEALDKYMDSDKNGITVFLVRGFVEYPKAVQGMMALELIASAAGSRRNITRRHVNKVIELSAGQVGRRISLPYGLTAEKTYEKILIYRERPGQVEPVACGGIPAGVLEAGDCGSVGTPYGRLNYQILKNPQKNEKIPQNWCTKWFDYDKITDMLCFRIREPGDFFCLNSNGHRQKLKDYFINEKVPGAIRDKVLLVAEGHHILWIAGYRISEYYRITKDTKRIIELQFMEE